MNEQDDLGRRIAGLLDAGTDNLGPADRERLAAARRMALAHHQPKKARAWVPMLAGAGAGGGWTERRLWGVPYLIPTAALIFGLAAVTYMHWSPSSDIADIDAGLLTDDLPINAYLDQGFDSWLKRSPR